MANSPLHCCPFRGPREGFCQGAGSTRVQAQNDMNTNSSRWRGLVLTAVILALNHAASAADSTAVKKLLANPPRGYATAPLWVWNDLLTEQQIRETMRDLAGQQVKQVFVHPRPGLMTPYLSPDWFRLWKVALNEAEKLDMNVWIYDENSYPSGFAGGWVSELMPESRGMGLYLSEAKSAPVWGTNTLAVSRVTGNQLEEVSAKVKGGETLADGRYVTASVQRAKNAAWTANRPYVDLLTPGVTEKFLEVTVGAYKREIGGQFGKRVPGIFTDEPNIGSAGGWPWCVDLPEQFQRRWGYSLLTNLPCLEFEVGDWRRVRHNYFATLNALFIERWGKPYHDCCASNHLEFTGHYWDHQWPECIGVPDNMAMYAWHQRPAIDCLMNQYREDTHAQFGNVRIVKELSSVANQLGCQRTLCEIYGAGGWDLRFEDMKRIGDWLAVLGVNTMDEHLSYITLRGARKRDHPQSFSYHEPGWEAYHVNAGYLARVSCALSQGEQINRLLVLEPTTTAWMYQGNAAKLKEIGDEFFKLLMTLETAQIEYDIGSEDLIARHGNVQRPQGPASRAGAQDPGLSMVQIGQRLYQTVIIPPGTENLNNATVRWLAQGCPVICCGAPPRLVEGQPSDRVAQLSKNAQWKDSSAADIVTALDGFKQAERRFGRGLLAISRAADDHGILFHQRRWLNDGQMLFLVNTSLDAPSEGQIESSLQGVECWNLQTGKPEPYLFKKAAPGLQASFKLPPCGSLLLFFSERPNTPAPEVQETTSVIAATGAMEIRRVEPNVLTLDYVDITAGGETRSGLYFYQANQFAFQKNGMERNPWDSAVQFKNELITRKFAPESGFTASYKFTVEGAVPKNLAIVIERPDLYSITCNGKAVAVKKGEWWLDKAFGKISLASAAQVGENVVTIKAGPFTIFHEVEPAYLLGDFALRAVEKGFVVVPDQPLGLGKWNEQGHPFFSKGVAYRQEFRVTKPAGKYAVSLPKWYGSVARVNVNGKLAGYLTSQPWECDVTPQIKTGANTIEVVVIGTLKNTLGPHHNKPVLGSAWPGMFQKGPPAGQPPGQGYDTVGYGLFEPFGLKQTVAAGSVKQ